jgi:transcriptional regulator with XRE-family HTH domain
VVKRSSYVRDEKLIKFLAKRVKELRAEHELTQEELANEAEIGIAQLKRIETAAVNTSVSSLYRITKALNINFDEFFEGFKSL